MTKEQFLLALHDRLSSLPGEDREQQLAFYGEMIADRMEEGMTEEEAVAAVGSVETVAEQILSEKELTSKEAKETGKLVLLAAGSPVWIPLLVAVFAVAISGLASLWVGVVSLWAAFGALVAGAVGGIAGGIVTALDVVPSGLGLIGCALFCAGLAIFLFFGCREVTKAMTWLTKQCVKLCKTCFFAKKGDAR